MEYISINNINIPKIGFGPGICDSASYIPPKNKFLSFSIRAFNRLFRRPFRENHYIKSVSSALQSGFTLLDYSAAYGDGSLIRKGIERSGTIKIESLIITTRVSNRTQFSGPAQIEKEFKSQLKNLNTDYVDILMFHWPVTDYYEKTWLKMIELQKQGYCRILGVANCHAHHLERLESISGILPSINQVEVTPLFTQKDLLAFCKEKNIQVEAYTPIARFDDRLMRLPVLRNIAEKYQKTIVQVVLRWHIQCGVIPVVRTMNPRHQKENLDIFDFSLTDEEVAKIDAININARVRYDPDNCDFTIL